MIYHIPYNLTEMIKKRVTARIEGRYIFSDGDVLTIAWIGGDVLVMANGKVPI